MNSTDKTKVTIQADVQAPVEKVWQYWNEPDHMTQWNFAIDTWHSPWAKNDLRVGGTISARMEAKDGSFGFDFGGVYDEVELHKRIAYTLGDGRKVEIDFRDNGGSTHITETFDAENENPVDMQRDGWQAILNNFKKYAEQQSKA